MPAGPQKYPGASLDHWYQDTYPGSAMEVNTVLWHSTEGRSLPSYGGGASAPNLTAVPDFGNRELRWYQHHDIDRSSRALVNEADGVQTNTLNVCQVEIVGTCDWVTSAKWLREGVMGTHLYMPDLPDWAVRDLAEFARWMYVHHGVPLDSPVTFRAYPRSYGGNNGVRMSQEKWNNYRGHCGHQHAPENLHGDPGALPMRAILDRAKGDVTVAENVPGLNVEAPKPPTYREVLETDAIPAPRNHPDYAAHKFWTGESYLRFIAEQLIDLRKELNS